MRFTAEKYVDDVLSGRVVAGRWTLLACWRHRDDLAHGHERGLYFDQKAAMFAVTFFHLLPLWEGEWAGQPMRLEPAQQFWVWSLFGWKREDGTRRFRTGYLEVARKNAKTTWAAGLGLLMAFFDQEPGAQVYSAATKRDQAKIVHDCATRIVKGSPELRKRVSVFRSNLHQVSSSSKFEPLSADYNKLDGLNCHCVIADELHAWPRRQLWSVLRTSMGSRRQPMMLGITTAGVERQSVCYVQRDYLTRILLGQVEDDAFWGMIYTLDMAMDWPDLRKAGEVESEPEEGGGASPDLFLEDEPRFRIFNNVGAIEDDWRDEDVWLKANPLLGVSKKWETLRQEAREAFNKPSELNGFLRWNMNVWTQASERWLSPIYWARCGGELPDLRGRECYAGLDLSSTNDLTALVLVFPVAEDKRWWVLPRFWCPEASIVERSRSHRVPYEVWRRAGLLTATPGNMVDYSFVMEQLRQDMEAYDLRELAYDRWGSQKVVAELRDIGFEIDPAVAALHGAPLLVQFGQGFASMSGPMKELETMVGKGELGHGGNPVLSWMADNVVKVSDAAGNIKPDKSRSREKIDGIVALIMGVARAIAHGTRANESVYESRGLRTV